MGYKQELEKRIEKKKQEISDLHKQAEMAEHYLQDLIDSYRLIPRDERLESPTSSLLRAGSDVAKARDVLRTEGLPLHIKELVKRMGKEPTKAHTTSLSGSLGAYVRKGEIFTRPLPNKFGLKEFGDVKGQEEGLPLPVGENDEETFEDFGDDF